MTEATKLLQGSDKDFAVVRSTLIDSQATAKMLAENSANRRYRRALLGEARRIAHTLDTLDKMKAQHDALVAEATELLKNATWDEDSVGYARVLTQDIEALKAALEQVK
jgi:hypothetical protein|tara:strand:- start:300 stop:626 length:327 start_codon:yes stop_codon:yes gene_type:complete